MRVSFSPFMTTRPGVAPMAGPVWFMGILRRVRYHVPKLGVMLSSALALTLSAARAAEEKQAMPTDLAQLTPAQIIADAETVHPAALYILATKLMAEGRMDDAVRWFYIGQLRYRFLLAAEPERRAENQPLFSAPMRKPVASS